MKRVLLLSACAVLLCTTLQYGQSLSHHKLLYHSIDGVRWTQCAFGEDGVLWVIWAPGSTNDNSGGPVYVISYDGTNVSTPVNLTDSGSVRANRPHISVSPKGNVLASWGVVGTKSTYLRIRDRKTKTWGAIETVNSGDGGNEPCAQMDKNGNIHVLFSDESGGRVFARSKINGAWQDTVKLSQGYGKQGSLAIAPNGSVHAVWIEKNATSLYQNVYTNRTLTTGWYSREFLPQVVGASNHPWIAVGPNNKPVIAYQDVLYPDLENGSDIKILKLGGTPEVAIDFYMQHFPRVVVDKDNVIHVVSQIGGGDFGSGTRYSNNKGGEWMPYETFPAAMDKVPGLAADPFGNIAVCQSSWSATSVGGTDIWVYSQDPIVKVAVPEADFTFSPTTGYPPLSVNFNAVATFDRNNKEVTYSWVFGDGATATGRNVSHVYQTAGTFNVNLTIMDSTERTDDMTQAIVVKKTNPLVPTGVGITIGLTRFWKNPEITFNLTWAINPDNIPEHIEGYAIYIKEGTGEYTRLTVVSPSTLAATFPFTDLSIKRSFAISTLGFGGTESPLVDFQ